MLALPLRKGRQRRDTPCFLRIVQINDKVEAHFIEKLVRSFSLPESFRKVTTLLKYDDGDVDERRSSEKNNE